MKNKKKIGFTLVELLAVIVILSIIMTITVPIILVQVKKAEKRSFEISVELVKKNTEDYLLKQELKRLPDCETDGFVNLEELSLKNKENAFSLENSYVCYDSKQQCNYIYAISKKKNYKIEGCYDDNKITEIDKSVNYSIPKFTNFGYQDEDDGSSLVVDIDWYDKSEIKEVLYRIKEAGTNNWSAWQSSKKFTGINFEKKYTIQSKATNGVGRYNFAKTTTEPISEDTPTCILQLDGTKGNSPYYKTNVKVYMTTSSVKVLPISYSDIVTSSTPSYEHKTTSGYGTSTFTVTKNGTTTLYGYVKTSDDKKSSCSKKVIKDTNPESVSITATNYTQGWSNNNVTLKANIKEGAAVSGYKSSYTYQWYKDGAIISGATSSTYLAKESGNYTVKVTSGSGKEATSDKFNVLIDTMVPNKPTISAKNYGKSIDFKYSSSDSESGLDHYVLNYIDSTLMGTSSTKYESVTLSSSSNTYSVNTHTGDTYAYYICAVDKAGNKSCSNKTSITTYIGIPAANRTNGDKISYGGRDWFVINDSGSAKGSFLTLISEDLVGYSSGGNSYNYANTYLNDQSLSNGYMASNSLIKKDCNIGGIIKQNWNCITSDSGDAGYDFYTYLSSPYWIGAGKVVVPYAYLDYSGYNKHMKAAGAAGRFTEGSLPDKSEITASCYTRGSFSYHVAYTSLNPSPSNDAVAFNYNGTVIRTPWYGSDYFEYFTVRPIASERLRITKYDVKFDCNGTPQNCKTSNSSYQNFTDKGALSVKVCGGDYMSSYPYLSWRARDHDRFLYGRGSSMDKFDSWSSLQSITNVYIAGKATATTSHTTTDRLSQLIYDNRSDSSCENFGTETISSTTAYFYYRPYIYVYESYDKDGN